MSLSVRVSPHQRQRQTTGQLMRSVCYALLPGIAVQSWLFGWGILIQILLAISCALLFEAGFLRLRGRPVSRTLADSSALLTALLLAIAIPPYLPWWITVIGVFIAIVVAKQLYGGLGNNLFNPAMVAYVALLVSFPLSMTSWTPAISDQQHPIDLLDALALIFTGYDRDGFSVQQLRTLVDGSTGATALDAMRTALGRGLTVDEARAAGVGSIWGGINAVWVNLAYLAGGLWLLARATIRWQIPLAMLLSLSVLALGDQWLNGDTAPGALFYLLSGATMLGAFFIATDPVSASTTVRGRLIYGAIIGVLLFVIRRHGGYADAVAFAVLLANLCVPLIDHYTQPRTFGHRPTGDDHAA